VQALFQRCEASSCLAVAGEAVEGREAAEAVEGPEAAEALPWVLPRILSRLLYAAAAGAAAPWTVEAAPVALCTQAPLAQRQQRWQTGLQSLPVEAQSLPTELQSLRAEGYKR
jgi:hypothetical protein